MKDLTERNWGQGRGPEEKGINRRNGIAGNRGEGEGTCALDMKFREEKNKDGARKEKNMLWDLILVFLSF